MGFRDRLREAFVEIPIDDELSNKIDGDKG